MTQEERNIDANSDSVIDQNGNQEVNNQVEKIAEIEVDEGKLLSTRDAIAAAIDAEEVAPTAQPKRREHRKKEVIIDNSNNGTVKNKQEAEELHAPAEYSKEEAEDFNNSSYVQKKAALRLHKSRMRTLEEIKSANEELKRSRHEQETYKKLVTNLEPYIRARGLKESPEVALAKALEVWRQFEEGDPKVAAASYLKAKGIDVPELLSDNNLRDNPNPKIDSLQNEINSLKSKLEHQEDSKLAATLQTAWKTFEESKNASGGTKFPDINNTETGLILSSQIGSLVTGKTDLSKQFIANCQSRIPNLSYSRLIEEAYKYLGGRIDDTTIPTRTQNPNHIERSNRAASSVPGRTVNSAPSAVKKYQSRREAIKAALRDLDELENG